MTNTNELNKGLSVEEIKERINDAQDLRKSMTGYFAHEVLPQLRGGISKIHADRNLTKEGQLEKSMKFKKQREVALMKGLSTIKGAYDGLLTDARASVENLLLNYKVEEPSEIDRLMFEQNSTKIKNDILFAPTNREKLKAIQRFSELADGGQYFAQKVYEDFSKMSAELMGGTNSSVERTEYLKALRPINAKLEEKATTTEQRELGVLLDTVKMLQGAELVNIAVMGNALREFGTDAYKYANKTEQYFVDKAEQVQEYEQMERFGQLIK